MFWRTNGLNALAELGDYREITRRINGGYNGWDERLRYHELALRVLGAGFSVAKRAVIPAPTTARARSAAAAVPFAVPTSIPRTPVARGTDLVLADTPAS
jgi:putative chitinase